MTLYCPQCGEALKEIKRIVENPIFTGEVIDHWHCDEDSGCGSDWRIKKL